MIKENKQGKANYVDEFLKKSKFSKIMEEGKKLFPIAIFITRLNTKNKKIATSRDLITKFLMGVKEKILQKYSYLVDEKDNFHIIKLNLGWHIPIKSEDLEEILNLLNEANKISKEKYFIELSHKSPNSENSFAKVQFKNIPLNIDNQEKAKSLFEEFGSIENLYYKEGIWTILFAKLEFLLPLAYSITLESNPKSRWFKIGDALCLFTSKVPCSKCKIRGHSNSCCPGESLISKLKQTNQNPNDPSKKNLPPIKKIDQDDDLLVSSSESPPVTPVKKPNKDKNKPSTKKKKKNKN